MEPGLTEAGYNNKAPGYNALTRNSGLFEYVTPGMEPGLTEAGYNNRAPGYNVKQHPSGFQPVGGSVPDVPVRFRVQPIGWFAAFEKCFNGPSDLHLTRRAFETSTCLSSFGRIIRSYCDTRFACDRYLVR
jgi:hypothetical protein